MNQLSNPNELVYFLQHFIMLTTLSLHSRNLHIGTLWESVRDTELFEITEFERTGFIAILSPIGKRGKICST